MSAGTAPRIIEIEVLRYRPGTDAEPVWQTFRVPFLDDTSVLEGLQAIKDDQDGSLSFRWSCRMAICGSCGMMIDGVPRLACHTFLREFFPNKVRVAPLDHMPIERDLVVSAEDFVRKLEGITPWLVPKAPRSIAEGEYLQTPRQLEQFRQFAGCINCMLCYAACPQYGLDPEFIGPGLMALIHRYNADSRDGARAERMELINAEQGVWTCTAVGYCSDVCPKHVDPANAVNQNKVNGAFAWLAGHLRPKGSDKP
jgi:fumarate reductase iron-sulfur subunit